MGESSFERCLDYERNGFEMQDTFYKEKLGAVEIYRFDYHVEDEKQFQQADIDLMLTFEDGSKIYISEKRHRKDFDNVCLEAYSVYPETPGWFKKCRANKIAYFLPHRVLMLDTKSLKEFARTYLRPYINKETFEPLVQRFGKKNGAAHMIVDMDGEPIDLTLMHVNNYCGYNEWFNEVVAIPIDCLKKFGVKYDEYHL